MPRLARKESAELRRQLAQWRTPMDMSRLVDGIMERIGPTNFFNQGGLAFLRDGWIAAEFGKIRQAERVRLIADTWPDFEIEIGGSVEQFEAVEADDPERKRGDEYRNSTGRAEDDPVEAWIERAERIPTWLDIACQKKARKRYRGPAGLVIYLNPGEYGIRQREIEASQLRPSSRTPSTKYGYSGKAGRTSSGEAAKRTAEQTDCHGPSRPNIARQG